MWIDSHCHLDAAEFDPDRDAVIARARAAGVGQLVLPAVAVEHFEPLRLLAQAPGMAYALGIHPLYVEQAGDDAVEQLRQTLAAQRHDPKLVAVGEIGLDHFVPGLDLARQQRFYLEQLRLARDTGLPVIVHVRRSADALLQGLRRIEVCGGIVHAFNGSEQQARQFIDRGFAVGFGGALTFERALQIRRLAQLLPMESLVLETDAPDIPPHWLYRTADVRRAGAAQGRNEPAELPRIGATLAALRGLPVAAVAAATRATALRVLPRLAAIAAAATSPVADAGPPSSA